MIADRGAADLADNGLPESSMDEGVSKLQIAERQVDDITVLTLTGEITADDGDIVFGKRVDQLIGKGQVKLVVNLAGVTYIDSAGVGMIARRAAS